MPELPPVTTATLPERPFMMCSSGSGRGCGRAVQNGGQCRTAGPVQDGGRCRTGSVTDEAGQPVAAGTEEGQRVLRCRNEPRGEVGAEGGVPEAVPGRWTV